MAGRDRGRARRPRAVAMAVVATAVLAAGCSGGSDTSAGDAASAGQAAPEAASRAPGGADAGAEASGRVGTADRPAVRTRAVIRRGQISLVTPEMNAARGRIDELLDRHGGYVSSEDTSNDRQGRPERSVLVLRVPEPAFDTVMRALADVGRPEHSDRSSEDVTTEVIDVDARVATGEAGLARLQRFLRRANDVDDMIRLESEIATRQAELESLKAQQAYLADQTAMSTVEVRLRTPATPAPPHREDDQGFLAGLEDGWSALRTVLVTSATVVGAMLPFLVTVTLLGVPVWLLARTARRRRPAGGADPATSEPG